MKAVQFPNTLIVAVALLLCTPAFAHAQDEDENGGKETLNSSLLSGMKFRCIGPAVSSGRIGDIAIHPSDSHTWYVGVASGGVWKTTNDGTTWEPIFDEQGSYSIGCVTIDPNNPHVVWVGTGENNSQRSVSYGDGVYKSSDGGKTWKNMGLKNSEHIGMITVDPRNSDIVYVAAQGPLWGPGGDRGLYKTTDGGKTWKPALTISEYTGVNEVHLDPRNPDVLYASSYQRGRHVWTLINGGPESMIFKSQDAGASWDTLKAGIPSGDLGRIGLAIAKSNPDVLYAVIEAQDDKGGVFRSSNRGASWERVNTWTSRSPQYYNEIMVDPSDENRIVLLDTWTAVSEDGGKTVRRLGNKHRHVDDHAFWFNPDNRDHLVIGGDGGIYKTYNGGADWDFIENLPVTQFYRVSTDNSFPFFWVYGGTQDNNSLGAPSGSIREDGILNSDWLFTNGGDGYETQVDPTDPNIVYAQAQYGWLVRFDKKSGERLGIQAQPGKDEEPYRWNWDSPLLLSPHSPTRIYHCANKVFRSDDRGNTWQTVSPDLSKQLNRDSLPLMGKMWGVDAIAKNASTSLYGNIVAFDESPLNEGWLYVGTDDGLVQITEDGGQNWRRIDNISGVPEYAYVSCVTASRHKAGRVYATFQNYKMADFKPYIYVSEDNGRSWSPIAKSLPENGPVWVLKEDDLDENLLFLGTEFGVFFSNDAGAKWTQLKAGVPTIAVRDLDVQYREDALVLGTFGRGFYVLDNYAPLRNVGKDVLEKDFHLFDVPNALVYVQRDDQGIMSLGSTHYAAPNPAFGATFTYYVKEGHNSLREARRKREKELRKKDQTPPYPTHDQLRAEDREEEPYFIFTIRDSDKEIIRQYTAPVKKGVQRLTWDLKYPDLSPVTKKDDKPGSGLMTMQGYHYIEVAKYDNGAVTQVQEPVQFKVRTLENSTLPAESMKERDGFVKKLSRLMRALNGAARLAAETKSRLEILEAALKQTPGDIAAMKAERKRLADEVDAILIKLNGDPTLEKHNENQPPSITGRVQLMAYQMYQSTSAISATHRQQYQVAAELFAPLLADLRTIVVATLPALERAMEQAKAPWTPGRVPDWKME